MYRYKFTIHGSYHLGKLLGVSVRRLQERERERERLEQEKEKEREREQVPNGGINEMRTIGAAHGI